MPEFTSEIAEQFLATCARNAEAIAAALSAALDRTLTATAGEKREFDLGAAPDGWDGPGLVLVLDFGGQGAVAALPAASGLLPESILQPGAPTESTYAALRQALEPAMVSGDVKANAISVHAVLNVGAALLESANVDSASVLPITISDGERGGALSIVAPVFNLAAIRDAAQANAKRVSEPSGADEAESSVSAEPAAEDAFSRLPSYTRSLLKIGVPVVVRLAAKKQTVSEILELGPGAILKFEKRCDESLDMCVGDRKIAAGEVVKVGDKFGLRVSSIALPAERFHSVQASMRD